MIEGRREVTPEMNSETVKTLIKQRKSLLGSLGKASPPTEAQVPKTNVHSRKNVSPVQSGLTFSDFARTLQNNFLF